MAKDQLLEIDAILELLERQPVALANLAHACSEGALAAHPVPGQWSILENLHHLFACEVVWGKRITDMLDQDHPTLRANHPMAWLASQDLTGESYGTLVSRFSDHRAALLARLVAIPIPDWQRGATFTGGGKPREYTVHTEADALARHERAHVKTMIRYTKALP